MWIFIFLSLPWLVWFCSEIVERARKILGRILRCQVRYVVTFRQFSQLVNFRQFAPNPGPVACEVNPSGFLKGVYDTLQSFKLQGWKYYWKVSDTSATSVPGKEFEQGGLIDHFVLFWP